MCSQSSGMIELAFALLDIRRLIHVVLVALAVAAAHTFGSPGIRAEVDRWVVTPISRAAETVSRQFDYPISVATQLAKSTGLK